MPLSEDLLASLSPQPVPVGELSARLKTSPKRLKQVIAALHNQNLLHYQAGSVRQMRFGEDNEHISGHFDIKALLFGIKPLLGISAMVLYPALILLFTLVLLTSLHYGNAVYDFFVPPYQLDKDYSFLSPNEIKAADGTVFRLSALREVSLTAEVLGVNIYRDDAVRFSPKDLLLGWGSPSPDLSMQPIMFTEREANTVIGSKGKYAFPFYPYITQFHTIPFTKDVEKTLLAIKPKDQVFIRGDWVIVTMPAQPAWVWGRDSALGTDNTCENVLIKEIRVIN
ncbi:MAG: hypothetical protein V1735_05840 [Nanoarchaeota archaeon]